MAARDAPTARLRAAARCALHRARLERRSERQGSPEAARCAVAAAVVHRLPAKERRELRLAQGWRVVAVPPQAEERAVGAQQQAAAEPAAEVAPFFAALSPSPFLFPAPAEWWAQPGPSVEQAAALPPGEQAE